MSLAETTVAPTVMRRITWPREALRRAEDVFELLYGFDRRPAQRIHY